MAVVNTFLTEEAHMLAKAEILTINKQYGIQY